MPRRKCAVFVAAAVFTFVANGGLVPHPELTFKGSVESSGRIPGWDQAGYTSRIPLTGDFVRLVPPVPLAFGSMFSVQPILFDEWSIEIGFRVHGIQGSSVKSNEGHVRRSAGHGGRGLAFWYTKDGAPTPAIIPSTPLGQSFQPILPPQTPPPNDPLDLHISFFGNRAPFEGLGIVFDLAPSTPVTPRSRREYWSALEGGAGADWKGVVSGVLDDRTGGFARWVEKRRKVDMKEDDEAGYLKHAVGDCEAAFRNAPGLVWAKITYTNASITVSLDLSSHVSLSFQDRHYNQTCFSVPGVSLPKGYYFGLTGLASSSEDPDAVDVYAVEVSEVKSGEEGEEERRKREANEALHRGSVHRTLQGTSESEESFLKPETSDTQSRLTEAIDGLSRRVEAITSGPIGTHDPGRLARLESKLDLLIAQLKQGGMLGSDESQSDVSRIVHSLPPSLERLTNLLSSLENQLSTSSGSLLRLVSSTHDRTAQALSAALELREVHNASAASFTRWWTRLLWLLGGLGVVFGALAWFGRRGRREYLSDEGSFVHGRGNSVSVAMTAMANAAQGKFRSRGTGGKKMI